MVLIIMSRILSDQCLAIICVISFLIQSITLFDEYMKGKSVVNIEIGQSFNETLPAITICPGVLDLDKLSGFHPKYLELYKQYQANFSNHTNLIEANIFFQKLNSYVLADLIDIDSGLDTYELMKNYSFQNLDQTNQSKISVYISLSTSYIDAKSRINVTSLPIESIILNSMLTKCFTFFSHLQDEWRLTKMESGTIMIEFKNDNPIYQHTSFPNPIIIHSPNYLPILENGKYKMIDSNSLSVVYYSNIHIKRLGYGYDTNCRDYGSNKIRADCLLSCYQKHHDQLCNATALVQSPLLIRESILELKLNRKLDKCEAYYKFFNNIMSKCSSVCKIECDYIYYSFTQTKIMNNNDNITRIYIQHNDMPDIIIRYIAEITFISFACNFGGLLGMWLGVSFLSIIGQIKSLIVKLAKGHTNQFILHLNIFKTNNGQLFHRNIHVGNI